jgi:PAS domain-containing protein
MEGLENNRDAWFLEFLQNLPALAWAKDGAGRYVFVNSAAVKAFGKPKDFVETTNLRPKKARRSRQ